MANRFASRVAAVAAAALIGISGAALAEPHHGHRGHHGSGDFVSGIAALKSELNLNTSQQAMWDNAVAASRTAPAARTLRMSTRPA